MIRWYVIAALAAMLAAALAHDHWLSQRYKAKAAELATTQAALTTERTARAHEQRIAKEASDGYQAALRRIEDERRAQPDPVVRLCRSPRNVSAAAGSAGPERRDAEAAPDHSAEDAPDIGPALMDFARDCEANAEQLEALQEWVRAR